MIPFNVVAIREEIALHFLGNTKEKKKKTWSNYSTPAHHFKIKFVCAQGQDRVELAQASVRGIPAS